ncbi:MAG TPA: uridylate kinase [Methanoculleus sp.]|nr:uridylate kinase [Methanoculleus sp.]
MSDPAPRVVKIGGSLTDRFSRLIPAIAETGYPLLIVPGGGPFADAVRAAGIGEECSHWMAIAAMDQVGWWIASFGVEPTDRIGVPEQPSVLLPYAELRRCDPLPHSWEVTSDVIAAWVASRLGLDLLLLKSVDGLYSGGRLAEEVTSPITCAEVDPHFLPFVFAHKIRVQVVNGRNDDRVVAALRGSPVRGTVIHPRF